MESYWTVDRIQFLKDRFDAGLSYGDIAKEMGVTRNTVCGKIGRMQFPPRKERPVNDVDLEKVIAKRDHRNDLQRSRRWMAKCGQAAPPRTEKPYVVPFMGSLDIPFGELRDFKRQESNQCRYIAADPAEPLFLACGNETAAGGSYCTHHYGIAYNKPLQISDAVREQRSRQATKNWYAAVAKAQNGPMEVSA